MKSIIKNKLKAIGLIILIIAVTLGSLSALYFGQRRTIDQEKNEIKTQDDSRRQSLTQELEKLRQTISDYEAQGLNVEAAKQQANMIEEHIKNNELDLAQSLLDHTKRYLADLLAEKQSADMAAEEARKQAEEAAKQQALLRGKVAEGNRALPNANVSLYAGKSKLAEAKTDQNGDYLFNLAPGDYQLEVILPGYNAYTLPGLTLNPTENKIQNIALVRAAPPVANQSAPAASASAPSAPSVPSVSNTNNGSSTAHSRYERRTVETARGSFTTDIMTFDLSSGRIRVMTDTASDWDCTTNCPVKSVKEYVEQNGAFAGIHGTYFCPSDYSWCSSQVNYFFWKIFNSRVMRMINASNGFGENDHFLVFDGNGKPRYFAKWSEFASSGFPIYAGINSKPALVYGGQNIIDENSLDNKQRNTKTKWGALGLKGETLYTVVGWNVTMVDMAAIMTSLGMDAAMGIDGGGSTAVYYKGAYKLGPGRGLPNAIVFVGE